MFIASVELDNGNIYIVDWIREGKIGHTKNTFVISSEEPTRIVSYDDENVVYLPYRYWLSEDKEGICSVCGFSVAAKNEQDAIEQVKNYIRKMLT